MAGLDVWGSSYTSSSFTGWLLEMKLGCGSDPLAFSLLSCLPSEALHSSQLFCFTALQLFICLNLLKPANAYFHCFSQEFYILKPF